MTEHIYKRLDELGPDQVRHLMETAGLPEGWRPHILQWLEKKRNEKADQAKSQN